MENLKKLLNRLQITESKITLATVLELKKQGKLIFPSKTEIKKDFTIEETLMLVDWELIPTFKLREDENGCLICLCDESFLFNMIEFASSNISFENPRNFDYLTANIFSELSDDVQHRFNTLLLDFRVQSKTADAQLVEELDAIVVTSKAMAEKYKR